MILLDAIVVAEALRRGPKPGVVAWLNAQMFETLYLPATGAAELLREMSYLPVWHRKNWRGAEINEKVLALFEHRILPFDLAAMRAYGAIMEHVRHHKLSISRRDGLVAAVAKANGLMVASRNGSPFIAAGLTVCDPWRF
jgi:predicted nucleic acid-binding protein